jgi:hypothetical protein
MNEEKIPQRENITEVLKKYKEVKTQLENKGASIETNIENQPIGKTNNFQDYEKLMTKETDPDLMMSYEIVQLPSKGIFYQNRISELNVEYMTSKDEDLITTPSIIDSGNALDLLLKRKIKTPNVSPEDLLGGDRNAVILYLRTSSYGTDYNVNVTDPRDGSTFKYKINLLKLKYKELTEIPDDNGHFNVDIPMRKKNVVFRLLTSGQDNEIFKKAEAMKVEFNEEFSQYNTLKLKASIISIGGNLDRTYINRFVDAMPSLDAFTIRKKILEVSPDVDMTYEFTSPKDEYKFNAQLSIGLDFFFPQI